MTEIIENKESVEVGNPAFTWQMNEHFLSGLEQALG